MNMVEALDWAAKYAEENKLFAPVLNTRGYPDGWTPPSPEQKLKIIKDLALTVFTASPSLIEELAMKCDHGYVICVRCDHVPPSWRSFPLT